MASWNREALYLCQRTFLMEENKTKQDYINDKNKIIKNEKKR